MDLNIELTLKEKIAQMLICGIEGTTLDRPAEKLVKEAKVGGVILYSKNTPTAKDTFHLTNSLQTCALGGDSIPLIIAIDEEHGRVNRIKEGTTRFVDMATVGKLADTEIVKEIAAITSRELITLGINMNFAPVCDVNVNPDNTVIGDRSFSSDPKLVAKLATAYIKEGIACGMMLSAKHFPGHGDTSIDSHLDLPRVDKTAAELEECELIPFKAAINANVPSIMTAHILFPKIDDLPATLSRKVIYGLLLDKYWYNGVVIADDMCMGAIQNHFGTLDAFTLAINAGVNMFIVSNMLKHRIDVIALIDDLAGAVERGAIDIKMINESVERILSMKKKYIKDPLRENILRENSLRQETSLMFAERLIKEKRRLSAESD